MQLHALKSIIRLNFRACGGREEDYLWGKWVNEAARGASVQDVSRELEATADRTNADLSERAADA